MSVQSFKRELRQQAEAARAAMSATERAAASAVACDTAIRMLEKRGTERGIGSLTLFSYMPFRTELDVRPVMDWCRGQRGTVLVPKVEPKSMQMSLHAVNGPEQLEEGKWGILEPSADAPRWNGTDRIDVMLVPGLAFDLRGGRLGYGGGYYDRFIAGCRGRGVEPFKLAVAFDAQLIPDVPMDEHDFRIDGIVTEKRQWVAGKQAPIGN
ncbi:5-formyltetrahydrofolate cyclo-ligase [Paenibacillus hodogayensis]|uniref:5-formyltetrahydrofolate cyclo-ligase n=1 Tax=Paenibacillus hodogayensis TaxID=279208 RepID=A0ABV5VS03_9BACL